MESPAREAYRTKCKRYGVEGGCGKRSYIKRINAINSIGIVILCTSDCNCARMKRYDKMNKKEYGR